MRRRVTSSSSFDIIKLGGFMRCNTRVIPLVVFIGSAVTIALGSSAALGQHRIYDGKRLQKSTTAGLFNPHSETIAFTIGEPGNNGGEANRETDGGPAQEQYENRAFPQTYIALAQQLAASQAI